MFKIKNRRGTVCPDVFEMLPVREYKCEFDCGKVYKNRSPYDKHLERVHNIYIDESNKYKCPNQDCNYRGKGLLPVRKHFQKVHMDKQFRCDKCSRNFLLESQLSKHKCVDQSFECPACPKTFKYLNLRNRHFKGCVQRQNETPKMETTEIENIASKNDKKRITPKAPDNELIKKKAKLEPDAKSIEKKENLKPDDTNIKMQNNDVKPEDSMVIEQKGKNNPNDDFTIEEIEEILLNMENSADDPNPCDELEMVNGISACLLKLFEDTKHF